MYTRNSFSAFPTMAIFVFAQVEAGYLLTLLQPSLEVSLQQNLISILSGTKLQIWRSFY
jgi:hypothetical protein